MTYKLLIADDEEIEINAFRVIVGSHFDNVVVFSSENGLDAIETAKKEKPDIIFMDIEMPGLDGLAAIAEIKKTVPSTRFIVHTAYGNFDYAQKAVKIGASDYLLKPVKMETLIHVIKKNIEEIDREKNRLTAFQALEQKLSKVQPLIEKDVILAVINGLGGYDILAQYSSLYDIQMERSFCAVFKVVQKDGAGISAEENVKRKNLQAQRIVEMLKEVCCCIAAEYISGMVLAIIPLRNDADEYNIRVWSMNLADYVRNKLKGETDIVVGIGGLCNCFENIRTSYLEAYSVLKEDMLGMSVKHFDDFKNVRGKISEDLTQMELSLCRAIMARDVNGVPELAGNIFNEIVDREESITNIKSKLFETCAVIVRYIETNTLCSLTISAGHDLEQIASIDNLYVLEKWFRRHIEKTLGDIGKLAKKRNSSIVGDVIRYIEENYDKEIVLENAAVSVFVTPYYLSRLFKKETGCSFNNYLTEVRIHKAKQLMRDTSKSLKEIAFETGFNSQPYFCMVFRKQEGISPTEYIQGLNN